MTTDRARRWIRDFWAAEDPDWGARLLGAALAPAELLFRLGAGIRGAWYRGARPAETPIPVISVGNLTVGGTGKTPVVRWLGDWLRGAGARTAVVTRGYGRDEVSLYQRWFGSGAVFSGRDRVKSVHAAGDLGFEVALVDDAFQHRRLGRAVDILLVAVEDPIRARMMPRGPYREAPAAARRATHIVLTRREPRVRRREAWRETLSRLAPGVPVLDADLVMGGWRDLRDEPTLPPGGDVLALCSVARPRSFLKGLRALLPGAEIELAAHADHHEYSHRDVSTLLARLAGRTVVCTEKDAVKLAAFPDLVPHCAVIGFRVEGKPQQPLRRAMEDAMRGSCAFR